MPDIDISRINQDLLRLGIADLRSGRFRKGIGVLHTVAGDEPGPDDTYCCLGGLSVTAAENGCEVLRAIITVTAVRREQFGDQGDEFLSEEVMRCYGFTTSDPELISADGRRMTATRWNDGGLDGDALNPRPDEDFSAIADAFERTYLS